MSEVKPEPATGPGPQEAPTICPTVFPYSLGAEENGFNLLDVVRMLKKRGRLVVSITLAGTTAAVLYALLATPIYRAQAVIAPTQGNKSSGASAALTVLGGFGAQLANSLGVGPKGADLNHLEELLLSHRMLKRVVEKYKLVPLLFPDDWDPATNTWRTSDIEDVPDVWDVKELLESIYEVRNDIKAGVLRISFDFENAILAEQLLGHFLHELALTIQEDALLKIKANRTFVEEQLQQATDPVIIAKLQNLLSEQVEEAMMAQNTEQFAYEMVDPPAVSDKKIKPKRTLIAIIGLASSSFLAIIFAFFLDWVATAKSPNGARITQESSLTNEDRC